MKKNFVLLLGILVSTFVSEQIGIYTATPQSTLDVVGKNADITKVDGIIAPRQQEMN